MMNEINLSYAHVSFNAPIVHFILKEGAELGFPEIREMIACAEKLSDNKPYVTFSDVRATVNITNEGRKIIADPKNMPLFRGTAVLVKNSMYKYAVNFLNYYNRPAYPYRAFTSEKKAIEWLLTLPLG